MRLALVIPHFSARVGGAEGFALSLARCLAARGHEVHVVARDGEAAPGIPLHLAPADQAAAAAAAVRADLVLDWGLTIPADIHRLGGGVHREYLRYNRMGCPAPVRLWKWLEARLGPKHRRTIACEMRLLADPHTHLLAVSRFVADQVRRCVVVPDERLTVLHNGVDTERFRSGAVVAAEREACRREWGLAPEHVAFAFVGHNLRLKNLALLLAAFPRIVAAQPQARLVVIGKRRPRLSAPWLVCPGPTGKPERGYAAADVLVHPTYYDACANVVLEALAAGLPVVSSDQNGSAEILTPGQEGFVLPVAGPPAAATARWAEVLTGLAADHALRERLGTAARALACQHSLAAYVGRFEAYLERVAAGKRNGTVG